MVKAQLHHNRLYCNLRDSDKNQLFFSLVDYRNNYFTSNDPDKIIEFYDSFENSEQLIQWMKERPKGSHTIHEVNGDKDIIVVIPTADFNGDFAKNCRDNIFKGLYIIFVESGGREDFYFNLAHNVNVGIRKAMEYNPKWIIVSNDDMYKIDDAGKLKDQLLRTPDIYDVIFITEGKYHSRFAQLSSQTLRRKVILNLMGKNERTRLKLEKKFLVELTIGTTYDIKRYLYKPIKNIRYLGSFSIFSYAFVKRNENGVFDETYINGMEDIDLSINIHDKGSKLTEIDYLIGDIVGGTIGSYDTIRRIHGLLNDCYFNYKFSQMLHHYIV